MIVTISSGAGSLIADLHETENWLSNKAVGVKRQRDGLVCCRCAHLIYLLRNKLNMVSFKNGAHLVAPF